MAACLALIYAALPVGLAGARLLRRHGLLTLTLAAISLISLFALLVGSRRLPPGYLRLQLRVAAGLGGLSLAALPFAQSPEEWIHLPEYLALGVLLHGALRHDWGGLRSCQQVCK